MNTEHFKLKKTMSFGSGTSPVEGFTLIELLVVIAIIAILAAIILPVLEKAKQRAQNIEALSNLRQLLIAWKMYSTDNQNLLPLNKNANGQTTATKETYPLWVVGDMRDSVGIDTAPYSSPEIDCTNYLLMLDTQFSQLGSYIQNASVFRDPGDQSLWDGLSRVRSFSMNCAIGAPYNDTTLDNGGTANIYRYYNKESDIIAPSPSDLWVFLDEHPDSINDGYFEFSMPSGYSTTDWTDIPAAYHNGACAFAFADGHGEFHRWLNSGVFPPVNWVVNNTASTIRNQVQNIQNNSDVWWFAQHTSALKPGQSAGGL